MTVGISNSETPCIHKASNGKYNYGQIMQFAVTYAAGVYLL